MRKSFLLSIVALVLLTGLAVESNAQSANQFRHFDLNANVLSYSRQGSVNMYGGTLGFAVNTSPKFGIVADLGIHEPSDFDLTTTTYRFGPRMTQRYGDRVSTFGQVLLGGAHLSDGIASANGFAMLMGGGVDIGVRPWIAIRAIEGGYSAMHFTGGWSNGVRLSGGVVFRFGANN